jgi:hypothetical protein
LADRRGGGGGDDEEQRTVAAGDDDVRKHVLVVAIVGCNCHAIVLRAANLGSFCFTWQNWFVNQGLVCCLRVATRILAYL